MPTSKTGKSKRGRPPTTNPMNVKVNFRITPDLRSGIEAYQEKYRDQHELPEMSDAIRHMLKRVLREEGLLK